MGHRQLDWRSRVPFNSGYHLAHSVWACQGKRYAIRLFLIIMEAILNTAIRVATLNVRGLNARRRQYQLSRLFLENDLDIIAVQETKIASQEQADRMVQPFVPRYSVCVCHAAGTSGGCAIFLRNSLNATVEAVTACETGRLIVVDFALNEIFWRVICIYAPNRERERESFFDRVEDYLKTDRFLVLLGDFNCVCFPEDRVKSLPVNDHSALLLNNLVSEYNLEDVGYVLYDHSVQRFTHFQGLSHARLDRAYVSLELVPLCKTYENKQVSFSDHSLVAFTIGTKEPKTNFSWDLWKLNDKLLSDDCFVSEVKEKLTRLNAADEKYIVAMVGRF